MTLRKALICLSVVWGGAILILILSEIWHLARTI